MSKIDIEKEVREKVPSLKKWVKDYFDGQKNPKAVIGVSGGKDSTVVLKLLVDVLGAERVIPVYIPFDNQAEDKEKEIIEFTHLLKLDLRIIPINDLLSNFTAKFSSSSDNYTYLGSVTSRLRGALLMTVAQEVNGRVINTNNLTEKIMGHSTLYGDTIGCIAPLGDFTSTEVYMIGAELEIPPHLLYIEPTDGVSGLSDQAMFGFPLENIDSYIRTGFSYNAALKEEVEQRFKKWRFKDELSNVPIFKTHLPNFVSNNSSNNFIITPKSYPLSSTDRELGELILHI